MTEAEKLAAIERMESAVRNLRISMAAMIDALQRFSDVMNEALKESTEIKR